MGGKDFLPFPKSFDTMCLHNSQDPRQWKAHSIIPHIVTSTIFKIDDPREPRKFVYGRSGNPTRAILQSVLSVINNARLSFCFSSGMSALAAVLGLLNSGEHMICCKEVSEETYEIFNHTARRYDICTTFTDLTNLNAICEAIQDNTKLIWAENPTDAALNIVDICNLATLAKERNILLGVNNSFLTPYLQRPLELGADLVMQSLTKYINGHSDIIMGSLSVRSDDIGCKLKMQQELGGMIPSPIDCYQVLRGIKTLSLRMDQHMKSSLTIAHYLSKHPAVEKVIHPGLKTHPHHNIFKSQASGHSGLISFYIKGGLDESKGFLNCLKLFTVSDIAGGCESTAQIPCLMSHKYMSNCEKEQLNITENLIKISVGVEEICDLLLDIEQSLDPVRTKIKN